MKKLETLAAMPAIGLAVLSIYTGAVALSAHGEASSYGRVVRTIDERVIAHDIPYDAATSAIRLQVAEEATAAYIKFTKDELRAGEELFYGAALGGAAVAFTMVRRRRSLVATSPTEIVG